MAGRPESPPGTESTVVHDGASATATVTDVPRGIVRVGRATEPAVELAAIDAARYELGAELAHGGMGRIRSAFDIRLQREVAIKELLAPDDGLAARFEREALVTARLQHPSIVAVYEAGRWPSGAPFFAMKLVHGRSLKQVIANAATLDARLALLPHVGAVADAMAYAHEHRIIHRDLKPANVLVGDFGETVVVDWGLAKDLAAGEADAGSGTRSSDASLTRAGSVMGTPSYMAPEQARGEATDERGDVYAIGALLYHLLVGEPPYVGEDSQRVIAMVAAGPPPPLRERVRGLAPDLQAIVERAMARSRRDRYPSARELAEDLRRFQTGQLVASHRYTRGELVRRFVRRHRVPIAIACAALTLLAVFGAYSVRRIVAERDQARAEKRRADQKQHELASEQAQANYNRDEFWVEVLDHQVASEPRYVLGTISALSKGTELLVSARLLAGTAFDEGLPLEVAAHSKQLRFAVSPDAAQLATAGGDGVVRLWDVKTLANREIGRHDGCAEAIAFSPDGHSLASGGADSTTRIWDLGGVNSFALSHPAQVLEVAFSADGKTLATWCKDGQLRIWDLATRAVVGRARMARPEHLVFAGRQTVVTACTSADRSLDDEACGTVHRVDLATGADTLLVAHATAFAATRDGGHFATVSSDGELRLWSSADWGSRVVAKDRLVAVAVSSDGSAVAGYSRSDVLTVWASPAFSARHVHSEREGDLQTLAFSGDRTAIAAVSKIGALTDLATDDVFRFSVPGDGLKAAVFAGDTLVGVGSAAIIAFPRPREPRVLAGGIPARQVLYTPAGRLLVIGSDRIAFDGASDAITLPAPLVGRAAIASDGSRLATLGEDGVVRVIDLSNGAMRELAGKVMAIKRASPRDPVAARTVPTGAFHPVVRRAGRTLLEQAGEREVAAFSPDGRTVACADTRGGRVHVWDLATGAARVFELGDTDVEALAFERDSRSLAVGDSDGKLQLFELASGSRRVLDGHTGAIEKIAALPRDRLASVAADNTLRIWNLATGEVLTSFMAEDGLSTTALAVAPDGEHVVDGDDRSRVRMWEVASLKGFSPVGGMGGPALALAYSPDGQTVAVASKSGLQIASRKGPTRTLIERAIVDVAYAPDGNHVAGVGDDGLAREWSDDLPRDEAGLRAYIDALGVPARAK